MHRKWQAEEATVAIHAVRSAISPAIVPRKTRGDLEIAVPGEITGLQATAVVVKGIIRNQGMRSVASLML